MKTHFLSLLFFASFVAAQAQTILSGTAPVPGDVHHFRQDSLFVSPGPAGQNQTWNFSTVQMDTAIQEVSYLSVAATPAASSFPTATVVQFQDSTYSYIRVASNKAETIGLYSTASGPIQGQAQTFANPITIASFPFSYNQTYADTGLLNISLGPGLIFTVTSVQVSLADGTGTLVLPGATHTNVLRVKTITSTTTSSLFGNSTSQEESYSWYDPATKFALFTVSTTTDNSGGTTTVSHQVNMRVSNIVSGKPAQMPMETAHIFPNPAGVNSPISVCTEGLGNVQIAVYNSVGKLVFEGQQNNPGGRSFEISTQGWGRGVYLVRVMRDGRMSTQQVVLE